MKYLEKYFGLLFVCAVLFFSACEKKKTEEPEPEDRKLVSWTVTLDATAFDKWVYFSFADTQVVKIDDFQRSHDWDIGFHRYDVRLNCGTSGPGQGGSYDAGKIKFESLLEAPQTGYSLNESIGIIQKPGEWVYTSVPGDTLLSGWISFAGPPPTYTINNNIYIIKTSDGKYAKIWLKDFYNDNSQSGHVTMKYVYQPDGSRTLK